MSLEDRRAIAAFTTERAAPLIEELPALATYFGAPRYLTAEFTRIANSGADALRRTSEELHAEVSPLDEVLSEFELADDALRYKLLILERMYDRWRDLWDVGRRGAQRLSRGARRALRVWSEALLKGLDAFLGSLISAYAAAALPTGPLDTAKEAKEYGEALISAARR